jgi:hypothetical protein
MTQKQRNNYYRQLFICLTLSVFAWVAVKMSKNYTQTYQFAINVVDVPKNKYLVYQSDTSMSVTIEAKGLSLLKYELQKKQLELNYRSLATAEQHRSNHVEIENKQLTMCLIKKMDFPEQSVVNEPTVLTLEFEMFPN